LDGSLKHLSKEGELYGNTVKRTTEGSTNQENLSKIIEDDPFLNDVEIVDEPVIEKNEFQTDLDTYQNTFADKEYNLSESVESWADYIYPRFHPRTVNIVNQYKHSNEKQTLDTYCCGLDVWKSELFEEEFCDKIRQYVEECDYLQGFQNIFDAYNGFSGLAMKCLEHVNDEYSKSSFVLPVFAPKNILFENCGK